jgi:hypothetical protein
MFTSNAGEIEYKEMSVKEKEAELRALYEDIESVIATSGANELEGRVRILTLLHLHIKKLTVFKTASGQVLGSGY